MRRDPTSRALGAAAPTNLEGPLVLQPDYPINPRIKIAALWAAMLFGFLYVDLISMYRADIRADIEAGKVFAFTIGQAALLGMTVYILIPSLMLFLERWRLSGGVRDHVIEDDVSITCSRRFSLWQPRA